MTLHLEIISMAIQSLLIAAVWVALSKRNSGSDRQRQLIYLSGFSILILLPFICFCLPETIKAPIVSGNHLFSDSLAVGASLGKKAMTAVACVWVVGTVLFLVRLFCGHYALAKSLQNSWPAAPSLRERCLGLLPSDSTYSFVTLRVQPSDPAYGSQLAPCVTGTFRPVVYLPESASEWSDNDLRATLLHEIAHLRRRDLIVRGLAGC